MYLVCLYPRLQSQSVLAIAEHTESAAHWDRPSLNLTNLDRSEDGDGLGRVVLLAARRLQDLDRRLRKRVPSDEDPDERLQPTLLVVTTEVGAELLRQAEADVGAAGHVVGLHLRRRSDASDDPEPTDDRITTVTRADLILSLRLMLEQRRLRIRQDLTLMATLRGQLQHWTAIAPSQAARGRPAEEDLALTVGLLAWYAMGHPLYRDVPAGPITDQARWHRQRDALRRRQRPAEDW